MSRWSELFEQQREEERAGTADPGRHAEEHVDLREELEEEEEQQQQQDDDPENDDCVSCCRTRTATG